MKINFPLLDGMIEFDRTLILTIEDTETFSDLARLLYSYNESSPLKLASDDFSPLKESQLMLVSDILGYNINTPAILKLVYADLESQFGEKEEVKARLESLAVEIANIISSECLENELDLEYDEITLLELIKAMGVKIETTMSSVYEKCYEIVQIFKYLSKKKLLVFLNVGAYLTEKQIKSLLEYIELCNLNVIFLEPNKLYDLPQYILDSDYYLEYLNNSSES